MTQLMPKVLIADTRSKVNDIDEIYFDVIVLFYHGDIMNKTWERPSGRLPNKKHTNAATPV